MEILLFLFDLFIMVCIKKDFMYIKYLKIIGRFLLGELVIFF